MDANLSINMDNRSFDDDNSSELAKVLRDLADKVEQNGNVVLTDKFVARDTMGNTVGALTFN